MSTINISKRTSDGRFIEIRHEVASSEPELKALPETIKKLNKAIDTFQKDERPE